MSCRKARLDMAVVYRGEFTATKFWQAHHMRKVTGCMTATANIRYAYLHVSRNKNKTRKPSINVTPNMHFSNILGDRL